MRNPTIGLQAAGPICDHFRLTPMARPLLTPGVLHRTFLARLLYHKLHRDAVYFLSFSMERRLAVWWGCLCIRRAGGDPLANANEENALKAAALWVVAPTDENRRATQTAGRAASAKSAAGLIALAAFFSGGSTRPAQFPARPPKPTVLPRAVSGSVLLAAAHGTVATEELLAIGLEVSYGRFDWTKEDPAHGS